jgi:hypothetical protein
MPRKETIERAREDKREGKSPSTQAGEFVREEIDKIREGEHGARSTKQAIAIGLSEARRAGVKLPPPKRGQTTERTRKSAEYAYGAGQHERKTTRRSRVSRAVLRVLEGEPRNTASRKALSRQAHTAASEPDCKATVGVGSASRPHQRRCRPLCRGQEGSKDQGATAGQMTRTDDR